MALCKSAVDTAWKILNEINPKANNSFIIQYDKENKYQTDMILGHHPHGGGWENVFMNVKDITPEQLKIFNDRKSEVPNSDMTTDYGNGITMIGWF